MRAVRSLGWFTRFMPFRHMEAVGRFYEHELGLPRIRSFRHATDWKRQDKDFFWGGECLMFETFYNGRTAPSAADGDPERAALVPIFRTDDLDALLTTWAERGIAPVQQEQGPAGSRAAFLRDPAGLLFGVRQVASYETVIDREALRRRLRGEAFNPACARMPAHLQELGWVRRRVADPTALAPFYGGLLGLALLDQGEGWAHYDFGDNSILELIAGGSAGAPPEAQVATTGVIILRVNSVDDLREAARSAGFAVVHEEYRFAAGTLSYIADGEGNLVGITDRHHPSAYRAIELPVIEDVEADRRWAEECALASST